MTTETVHPAATTGVDVDLVGRRVLQFLVDAGLATGLGYVVSETLQALFADPAHGGTAPAGVISMLVLAAVIWLGAFVVVPVLADDRTLGMRLLGLRVVRADGGRPGAGRHAVRFVALVVDTVASGLLGLVVMLRSRDHRRVGDMMAGTRVVRV